MSAQISCQIAKLNSPSEIADQIDHALRECWVHSSPVYITLPTDVVQAKVEGHRLCKPIDLSEPCNDPEKEDYVVDVIMKYLNAAKHQLLLIDACAIRHRVLAEVHELVEKSNLPIFVTPMGKGAVNEQHQNFGGVYAGNVSHPTEVRDMWNPPISLSIGALEPFSRVTSTRPVSLTEPHNSTPSIFTLIIVLSGIPHIPGVRMRGVLQKIANRIDPKKLSVGDTPRVRNEVKENHDISTTITQSWFWPRLGEFLADQDIVVTKTGPANFGIWDTKFPSGLQPDSL